jgi:hypothetical protein
MMLIEMRETTRTSHLTPHTSHLTPHTSHLTPHTSHLTWGERCRRRSRNKSSISRLRGLQHNRSQHLRYMAYQMGNVRRAG